MGRTIRSRSTMSARPGARDLTALHQLSPGEVWPRQAVAERKALIENTPAGRVPLPLDRGREHSVPDDILLQGARARSIEPGSPACRRSPPKASGHLLQRDASRRLDPYRPTTSARHRRDRAAFRP